MAKEIHVDVSLDDEIWGGGVRSSVLEIVQGATGEQGVSRVLSDRIGKVIRGCVYGSGKVVGNTTHRATYSVRLSFLFDKFRRDVAALAKELLLESRHSEIADVNWQSA